VKAGRMREMPGIHELLLQPESDFTRATHKNKRMVKRGRAYAGPSKVA